MKKNYFHCHLLFFLILAATNCFGQITFQKIIRVEQNDCAPYSIHQTTDGGYIITGYILINDSSVGVYLIKTNWEGDTLWTKTFGGTLDNYGYSVQQTSDDGYIVSGISTNLSGITNAYIIKTDALGDTLWTKAYALGGGGSSYSSIQQTKDSGYILIGSYAISSPGLLLLKLNAYGDSLWNKTYGGTGGEEGFSVKQTLDGGYIACGLTGSFGASRADIYVIKINDTGNIIWSKMYDGLLNDIGYAIQQTTDGGYIITGSTESFGAGGSDVFLIKTNDFGDTLWTKTYGGTGNDYGYDVQQTSDGGYIICGTTISVGNAPIFAIKTDLLGNTLWTKTYGEINDQQKSISVCQTSDGGYVMEGISTGVDSLIALNEIYLIKTDSNGNSGCYESSTNTIVGYAPFQVVNPNTIVSSGGFYTSASTIIGSGGKDSTLCLTVGYTNESVNNTISLYPNPTDGKLYIKNYQQAGKSSIIVTNILGQVALSSSLSLGEGRGEAIDVSHLASGIYFLQVKTNSGVSTMKFVKE